MKTFQYRKIDAFTFANSTGNPAACLYLESNQVLSDCEMLNIAKHHKGFVSEVIYCTKNEDFSYNLAYFSSECEVEFCGHGTIACMYNLIKENASLLNQKEIIIHTNKKGTLRVFNEVPKQDAVYITAPTPQYIKMTIGTENIANNLNLKYTDILDTRPIEIIDAGLKTLIVPVREFEKGINVFPNEQLLKGFCLENEVDIVLIFTFDVSDKINRAHTRVFAPKFGYLEDPATGSGNSAFGYYMINNNLWDGAPITLEQGGIDRIFNIVNLAYKDERILFGGSATTRIKGVYYL
jgi:PhzF family phenazine biosynthesis protein